MRRFKEIFFNLLVTFTTVLLFFAACEAALRFMPVDDGLLAEAVNANNPVFRFQPNQTLTWSRGPTFELVNEIQINNVGFVNNQNYDLSDERRLVAVVGDSQVEAAMVPYSKTLHGRMEELTGERVYSFAASGAPLSQYVIWAKHAKEVWRADFLIVAVIGNDYDESLIEYKSDPGFHYYSERDGGGLALQRVNYTPNPLRNIVKFSAVARYLLFNGQVLTRLKRFTEYFTLSARADKGAYSGNTSTSTSKRRVDLSKRAVNAFLRDLQVVGGWSPENVVFVVDGFRYSVTAVGNGDSYFGLMRRYFMEEARFQKFGVIDMDEEFFPNFESFAKKFEFPTDGHWNEHSHNLAAKAITENTKFKIWVNQPPPN